MRDGEEFGWEGEGAEGVRCSCRLMSVRTASCEGKGFAYDS